MKVRQVRFAETTYPDGRLAETLSRVYVRDNDRTVYQCCMVELPDRDNRHNISRIPADTYILQKLEESPALSYEHFWVHENGEVDAHDRRGIKWHIANYARQLRGCGAPGEAFYDLDGDGVLDVTNSEDTLQDLLDVLPARVELTIENQDSPERLEGASLEKVSTETLVSKVQNLQV